MSLSSDLGVDEAFAQPRVVECLLCLLPKDGNLPDLNTALEDSDYQVHTPARKTNPRLDSPDLPAIRQLQGRISSGLRTSKCINMSAEGTARSSVAVCATGQVDHSNARCTNCH
jgi:hypothetical protein